MSNLKAGGNTNTSTQIMKGVYLSEVEILSAEDKSKIKIFENNEDTFDLAIELTIKDRDFEVKRTIKGNFKRDSNGTVMNWGGAFIIDGLFKSLGLYENFNKEELDEAVGNMEVGIIPASLLRMLRGKKVFAISYVRAKEDGKMKYGQFNQFHPDGEELTRLFIAGIAKGYPSNYHPELIETAAAANIPVPAVKTPEEVAAEEAFV